MAATVPTAGEPGPDGGPPRLPPGQYVPRGWPVLHYGPVPKFDPRKWDLHLFGAVRAERRLSWEDFSGLPRTEVVSDFHCVTKFTVIDNEWTGVATSTVLTLAPPRPDVSHVMVWADYGYSANMRLDDFAAPTSLFATHHGGEALAPVHGFPVRLVVPHLYGWKGPKWV